MGSCPYGAAVKAGEPDWYYVTKADIDTWFSGFPYLFLLWVYGWVGRGYSLPLLAILNPNVPAAVGWQDLIASSLVGGRFNVVGTLGDAMDLLIQYHVFKDHCECLANVTGDCGGARSGGVTQNQNGGYWLAWAAIPAGSTGARLDISAAAFTIPDGGCRFNIGAYNGVSYQYSANLDINTNGASGTVSLTYSQSPPTTQYSVSLARSNPGSISLGNIGGTGVLTGTGCTGSTPAGSPGAITTTGIPTVTAPSGTTSDQLMTQLLVQQFELRQLADLVRSGPIGGSGLLPTAGTVHSGLSGDGEFTCVALQGVRVQLSGVPTSVDRWISHPDEYSGAGQISFQGQAGWTDNVDAAHLDQYIPCPVPASTKVGYHFLAGITATITEYPS